MQIPVQAGAGLTDRTSRGQGTVLELSEVLTQCRP